MGFIGLLRLLAVLLCIWLIWRYVRRKTSGPTPSTTQQRSSTMVACDVCGTHVPEDNAIKENDRWFCCDEHRDQNQH